MSAANRVGGPANEDGDFAALKGFINDNHLSEFPPHMISPVNEQTLDAAFLMIYQLHLQVDDLKRRLEILENGRSRRKPD